MDPSLLVQEKSLSELFPEIDYFLYRGVLSVPPMCMFSQVSDGTLSIVDLHIMHEILDLQHMMSQGGK